VALYVVGTPIGNMEDLSPRALAALKGADLVACEDTRRTAAMLARFGVRAELTSYWEHNEPEAALRIARRLEAGDCVALVSSAGTPGISDPGYRLVNEALRLGIDVIPIPGPCAFVAALSASGLPTDRFTFRGFPPRKALRRARELRAASLEEATQVFYESPQRVGRLLAELLEAFGDRRAVVAREVTKKFEQFDRGRLKDLAARWGGIRARGEFTVMVEGGKAGESEDLDTGTGGVPEGDSEGDR